MDIGGGKDFLQRLNNLAIFRPQYVKTLMTSRPIQQLQLRLKDASIVHISLEDDRFKSIGVDTDLQVFILNAVSFSSRVLLNEIADLLAIAYPSYTLSSAKTIVKSACGPLLEIMNDETVQVIHHSFTEFLLDSNRAQHNPSGSFPQFPVLDQNYAHKCLSGTLTNAVDISNDVSRVKFPRCNRGHDECCCDWSIATLYSIGFRKAKIDHPFLDYAIRNWTYHGHHYDIEDKSVFDAVSAFSNPESIDFRRWLTLEWGIRFITEDSEVPSLAHVAAFSGMSSYLKLLLSKTEDINSKDTGGRTLLHWADQRLIVQIGC
ncbi:hypothetical protein BGAL_0560g00040 [Botrytis galanthina]|uniref:Uncharacterized protein n=1 Tax=Botrytis galanthina TaxID=278940 RepID=A0A4S8QP14_9HELO|nr:hypothetical protein BGAL_0560g00040 [Botrytis galanthina]